MSETVIAAEIIFWVVTVYAAAGAAFGVYFVVAGVNTIDQAAKATGIGFRFIIFPGTVALWPLLIFRLLKGTNRPVERNAHRESAIENEGTE